MKLSSIFLLAATLSLQAEAPAYGVQGLVNIPLGDLKTYVDSKPGPGLGILGTFDLGEGHMLRPRLDYLAFPKASFATLQQTAKALSLGGDYLYFMNGKPEGLYLTIGASAMKWSFEDQGASTRTTRDTTKAGLAAGLGFQWSATLGTEIRFLHSKITSGFQAAAVQVGVTVRF